ncbi:hypothetical protein BZZ01_09155 [Nostocales cyanobacterium HT-58-2]|nr:hypothetical protein BZZ01_09155 [Nostocales cyanobacterium HT-58-2]
MSNHNYKYDVALSFAGEDRRYAQKLAQLLQARGINVFYDEYEEATLWGKNLYEHLLEVYQKQARFCVMFLSQHYARKLWTNHEREAAQARAFKEKREYILPIRLDNTDISAILPTIGYIEWSNANSIANTIVLKLESEQKTRSPVITRNSDNDLNSERDVDYTPLRDLLQAGHWKEADKETFTVMLKAVGKENGFLDDESMKFFPCTDLCTIDKLWARYSKERFGFSVQKHIWQSVDKDYEQFGNLVGWRMNRKWTGIRDVIYDTDAPRGHLPSWGGVREFGRSVWCGWGEDISSLTSLLERCNL